MIKVINKSVDVLFIILIVFMAGYFLIRVSGRAQVYKVETGSMEDGIHVGDYIFIVKKNSYHIGDVVTYRENEYFITHRIIKKLSNGNIVTKGDANNTEDDEISPNLIVGKVLYSGGLLNIFIDYKYAFVSLLLGIYFLTYYFDKKDKQELS